MQDLAPGQKLKLADLTPQRQLTVQVQMQHPDAQRTFCAIAMFENVGGRVEVSKEERYFQGHQDCDQHYGFGFQWKAGSK